ncbi:MAG TPA: hypothetical protein VEX13_18635, partial [Chloroflexia bacterium]|nr:hypothetical protein [Chloroflexia bacterium]
GPAMETALVVQGPAASGQGPDIEAEGSEAVSEDSEQGPVDLAEASEEESASEIASAGEEPQPGE